MIYNGLLTYLFIFYLFEACVYILSKLSVSSVVGLFVGKMDVESLPQYLLRSATIGVETHDILSSHL